MTAVPVTSVLQRLDDAGARALVGGAAGLAARLDTPAGRPAYPVDAPLAGLLPGGGLRQGSVVAVRGSTALLLALLAAATTQGTWAAVVGVDDLGVLAAAEAGVAVHRLALVPSPGDPGPVVAALLDGMGLVAVAGMSRLPSGAQRSLAARARQRGAVLLPLGGWPGADVELECRTEAWHGAEGGHGRLRSRNVVVRATGRGAAARPRSARLLLPGPAGRVVAVEAPIVRAVS